jgi:hypothetical protein
MTGSQSIPVAVLRLPKLNAWAVTAASGPGGHYDDWSDQLVDGGLAESDAADCVTRHIDGACLKRPGRGVPPPRSGPRPLVDVVATNEGHALVEHTPPDAGQLAVNPTSVCRDR